MENLTLGPATRSIVDRMEHVHLGVSDVDRSVDFYRRVFGFEVRYDGQGACGRTVHVGTDRFYVALTGHGEPAVAGGTFYHFGFTVSCGRDEFRRRLEATGVAIGDEARRKEGWAIYVVDPDGHEIEVVGYESGYVYA